MTIDLTDPIFHDEAKAHEWLEKRRDTGRIIAHLITIF